VRSGCAARRRDASHGPVLPEFFLLLEAQLPDERGPHGEPTVAEFASSDLLEIVDAFADRWDELPMPILGRPEYRDLIVSTRLVFAVTVRGQLSPLDGAVEMVDVAVDLYGPDLPPDEGISED
jgi:hypothetical protein